MHALFGKKGQHKMNDNLVRVECPSLQLVPPHREIPRQEGSCGLHLACCIPLPELLGEFDF